MKILEDTGSKIILGEPGGGRVIIKVFAVFVLLFFVGTSWTLLRACGVLLGGICFVIGLPLVILTWRAGDSRNTVEFNQPPGAMTVTKKWFLGSKRTVISPGEALRAYADSELRSIQARSMGYYGPRKEFTIYFVRIPRDRGESFLLAPSPDPEVPNYVIRRMGETFGSPTPPAAPFTPPPPPPIGAAPGSSPFCGNCGAPLSEATRFCVKCGAPRDG